MGRFQEAATRLCSQQSIIERHRNRAHLAGCDGAMGSGRRPLKRPRPRSVQFGHHASIQKLAIAIRSGNASPLRRVVLRHRDMAAHAAGLADAGCGAKPLSRAFSHPGMLALMNSAAASAPAAMLHLARGRARRHRSIGW